jgi:hypothetical protein
MRGDRGVKRVCRPEDVDPSPWLVPALEVPPRMPALDYERAGARTKGRCDAKRAGAFHHRRQDSLLPFDVLERSVGRLEDDAAGAP